LAWKTLPVCAAVSAVITPVKTVTFDAMNANPNRNSLQNVTEDAVGTVRTDGIEPYRSPYIKKILTDRQARISAIDFIGPDGTLIELPHDGPSLPDELVASLTEHSDDITKTAYFHVDTGATCVVTDQISELHCPFPTHATCGTAAKGPRTTINAMGWLVLDFVTDKGIAIPVEFPNATEIRQFQHRSLSCHALKDMGYDVQHALLATGNVLCLQKIGSSEWHAVPLVTHGRSDYVKVNLHLPAVDGVTTFDPHRALSSQTVARLDLINKYMTPSDAYALVMLIHLCYGCVSGPKLVALLKSLKIDVVVPKSPNFDRRTLAPTRRQKTPNTLVIDFNFSRSTSSKV
jgi:hypothetical protein